MFESSYQDQGSGLQRFLRALAATFRIGHLFGVEVRMYWIALLIPLLVLWGFSPLYGLVPWSTILGLALVFSVGLFVIIYTHEMGHIAAGWRYRINTRLITLSPIGGLAHMGAAAPRPGADIVISLAGPAVHLLWLAVFAPLWWWSDSIFEIEQWEPAAIVSFFWEINLALLVFNLLPFYPMDGGRVLQAVLAMRMNANKACVIAARVGMGGAVLFVLVGLYLGALEGSLLLCIGISNFLTCRRALVAARYQQSPYDGQAAYRAAWEADPDAWKYGEAAEEPSPAQATRRQGSPGRLRSWLAQRRERDSEHLAEELDRILAKINEQGMGSLTRAERRTLDRAAKDARGGH